MKKNKDKTAGIYDRWLSTLGGGEQVAFGYAETLRDLNYKTTLITHQPIDVPAAEKKMGVDLSQITLRYIPESSSEELSVISEDYDVFVNTSYLDYFPNRSKLGILSTFFPTQIYLSPFEFLKRALVVPSFRSFFIYPLRYEGFKFDQYKKRKIFKWLSKESHIIFKDNVDKIKISLYFKTLALSVLDQIKFRVNDQEIKPQKKQLDHKSNVVNFTFELPSNSQNKFTISLPDGEYTDWIALIRLTIPSFRFMLYNIFKAFFPRWEMRLHGGPGVTKRDDIKSYHRILTISNFCRYWIKKYWDLDSQVLYPPVNLKSFKPAGRKKNIILHVGRFFVTGHSKKQLQMVKLFQRLVEEKGVEDWELHLVGSVEDGLVHHNYFDQVLAAAKGYPVKIHRNLPFSELKKLFSQAKIYWHATGIDNNEEKSPILFEHFGITTVEAMASGAVPVVINGGGQAEIVTKGTGFKWNNRQEWLEQTHRLISNEDFRKKMSLAAIKRAQFFSRQRFQKRLAAIINESS